MLGRSCNIVALAKKMNVAEAIEAVLEMQMLNNLQGMEERW